MKRVLLLSSLALAGIFASCGDKNEDVAPKTTSKLLMAKSWVVTAYTEKIGNANATNEYDSAPACSKDNIYKFEANSKFTTDEGASKCFSAQTFNGNWALTNNDKTLTAIAIDQSSQSSSVSVEYSFTGTIEEISTTKFVLSESETSNGVTTVNRMTFSAK